MKHKLASIFLVLILFLTLAAPAFAEPTDSPSAPVENAAPANEAPAPEEAPGQSLTIIKDDDGVTRAYKEDGTLWYICDPSLTPDESRDIDPEVYEFLQRLLWENLGLNTTSEPYDLSTQAGEADFAPASALPPVKDHEHIMVIKDTSNMYLQLGAQHQLVIGRFWRCSDPDCGYYASDALPQTPENHSWNQDGAVGGCTNQGSSGHSVTYNYSCVCGATRTGTESEPHTLHHVDIVTHYHLAARHFVRWNCRCTQCGYTTVETESYPCPGNENGEGCVLPQSIVDPPDETE